jgi:hypothetical protein
MPMAMDGWGRGCQDGDEDEHGSEIRSRKEAVGRELFLFPWSSVALALWEKEWGARRRYR